LRDNEPQKPKLVPAGRPNDGLPDHWRPVDEPPIVAGGREPTSGPIIGPVGPGPFYGGTIPLTFQLTPDIMPTRYPGGIGGYRVMPPGAAGNANTVSSAQSSAQTAETGGTSAGTTRGPAYKGRGTR
jgi:hypothetical protein